MTRSSLFLANGHFFMHWLDLTIMGVYIFGCMAAGLLARGKEDSGEDYFTAGGQLNSWFSTIVVGLSIAGTFFSGITFIASPSVAYQYGIILVALTVLINLPLAYVVLRYWFLPRYLAGGWRFPYDVLEARFGIGTRTTAATLYVLMRIGWMAMMIYAPTMAIMTMGKLGDEWFWPIVLITGVTNTIYTVVSGIRGVIVTEAIQMVVITLGIGATIAAAIWQLPVPMSDAWADLTSSNRLDIFNFSTDPKAALTFWTIVIGGTVGNLANYLADQMSLQRYLATGNIKATSRAFFVNLIGVLVVLALLAGVGLSLFVYYANVNDPTLPKSADQVFPHFVSTRLPIGVAGLLLAALLAATSIPSGINTLAAVLTIDFHGRIKKDMTDHERLKWGRIYSLIIGTSSTLAAGVVSKLGTVFEQSQVLLGIFAGPLLVCVGGAVTRWRCPGRAMLAGILAGWAAGVYVSIFTPVARLWVPPVSAGVTLAVAAVLSLFGGSGVPARGFEVVRRTDETPQDLTQVST